MASIQGPNLSEKKFHNWIKQGIAIVVTKEGLTDIVESEIKQFHHKVYTDIQSSKGQVTCISCSTETVLHCSHRNKLCRFKQGKCVHAHTPCSLGICQDVRDKIKEAHRFSGPSWKNTDARKWANTPWEIAKCFMPPDGYTLTTTANQTDFNGIISVIINCKEFETKSGEDLSNESNIFIKARTLGKDYRHMHNFEVSDKDFKDNLKVLEDVLKDPLYIAKDAHAKTALQTLNQLSQDKWLLTDKNIFKHLQKAIDEAKESIDKKKQELLEEAQRFIRVNTRNNIRKVLSELHHKFSIYKHEIEATVQHGIKRLQQEANQLNKETIYKRLKSETGDDYELNKDELRKRLVQTYKSQCSTLPISPLLEEEELPLLTFYVKPYMHRLEHHKIQKDEISVDSYRGIFYKDKQKCKNIYITGDAGIGKTALCQRMVLLWCLVNSSTSLETEDESIVTDSESMKSFDFLFYISLRDTTFCHIEDIIMQELFGMSENKDFLLKILNREKCLIVLDGLDEWSHPTETKQCPGNIKIPHRQESENCVYLTTSRPYKLECLRLGTHEIDQQIEILAMEEGVGFTFVELLIERLNEKCADSKSPVTFVEDVAENQLDDLLNVPLITTHLICLWFDGKLRKMSLSEVYGNTLEMMFQRAFERKPRTRRAQSPAKEKLHGLGTPKCLANLKHVQRHISVLYKLSHLAFDALFSEKESSLVFSNSDLDKCGLSGEDITYLCSVGILSKNKAIGFLTERKHTLSFPHKLYQEFMAAVYISMSESKKDEIGSTIKEACKTLADVKKFSDVFIFLASLTPHAIEAFFHEVNAALSTDKPISDFREFSCSAMFNFISQRRKQVENKVKTVQDLALKCFDECKRSGGKDIDLILEDIFIYKNNASRMQNMLRSNMKSIKSIFTTGNFLTGEMCSIAGLVRLEIRFVKSGDDFRNYSGLMSASSGALKNLSISYCSQISELPLEKLAHLTSLYLHNVDIEHNHFRELVNFISQKHDISQIGLDTVKCEDHGYDCTLGRLDIQKHNRLYLLGIGGVNFENVCVNKSELYRLKLDCRTEVENACWVKPLLEDLMFAPVLKKLVVSNIKGKANLEALVKLISSLQNLKYLYLLKIDLKENVLWLDPEGKDLEIEMSHVTLTDGSFRCFVDSVAKSKKTVRVNLLFYTLTQTEMDAFSYIKSNSVLHVLRNTDVNLKFKNNIIK